MLDIKSLNKRFDSFSLSDINMSIRADDYHILLGQSGAGKSLLLELIAGIINADSGTIFLEGKDITNLPTGKRKIGLVFQSPAIFPHLSVLKNISYPLFRDSKETKTRKAFELAEMMGISHLINRRTSALSGGEIQRVALARIFASEPKVLLLDEPLSAIDASMRADIRGLLRNINNQGMPILHVTHDFEEAVALGTTITIIEKGTIIQSGTTREVIDNPKTSFSASFTGERNFFKVNIEVTEAKVIDSINDLIIKLGEHIPVKDANILVRSNSITIDIHQPDNSNLNNFNGVITAINPKKEGYQVCVDTGVNFFVSITDESLIKMNITVGMQVWISFKASAVEVIY
jgi:ABC-type Fe3+/spermidine/putrescine transport system ATPase subunit